MVEEDEENEWWFFFHCVPQGNQNDHKVTVVVLFLAKMSIITFINRSHQDDQPGDVGTGSS